MAPAWPPTGSVCWDARVVEAPVLSVDVPRRHGSQSRLLLLLHGYGEPVADLADRIDLIDPDGRFLAVYPEAPFERSGRQIWHRAMTAPDEAEVQFLTSMAALDRCLADLEQRFGLPASEAILGGFSQGGGVALGMLLGADVEQRPAAAFGVCSFAPVVQGFRVDRSAIAGRPYFLSSARRDRFAAIEQSRAGAALIQDAGIDLTYVESDGEHEMTDAAARQINRWLVDVEAGVPAAPSPLLEGAGADASAWSRTWTFVG